MADKADAQDLSQLATEPWVFHREVASPGAGSMRNRQSAQGPLKGLSTLKGPKGSILLAERSRGALLISTTMWLNRPRSYLLWTVYIVAWVPISVALAMPI